MRLNHQPNHQVAFTLIELGVILSTICLVFYLFMVPTIGDKTKGAQVSCLNRLRTIIFGIVVYQNDNDGRYPWEAAPTQSPTGASVASKPTLGETWQYFTNLEGYLEYPKLLRCPGDSKRTYYQEPPTEFTGTTNSLDSPQHRNLSISYFINPGGNAKTPQAIFLGDRNLTVEGKNEIPEGPSSTMTQMDPRTAKWWSHPYQMFHGEVGNIVYYDGSVRKTTTKEIREALRLARDSYGTNANRFLFPQ